MGTFDIRILRRICMHMNLLPPTTNNKCLGLINKIKPDSEIEIRVLKTDFLFLVWVWFSVVRLISPAILPYQSMVEMLFVHERATVSTTLRYLIQCEKSVYVHTM